MPYTPIVATLGYVMSQDQHQVLMVRRDKRPNDAHFGKYNGLGGKLEANENVVACIEREIKEEAGVDCDIIHLCGTISWPGFGPDGENWLGFIFRIDSWNGTLLTENEEGSLHWIDVNRIKDLPLWEGDREFLPLVFASPLRQFHGVMPYSNGQPTDWQVSFLQ